MGVMRSGTVHRTGLHQVRGCRSRRDQSCAGKRRGLGKYTSAPLSTIKKKEQLSHAVWAQPHYMGKEIAWSSAFKMK